MSEHEMEGGEHEEGKHPIQSAISVGDYGHVGMDGTIDVARGGTEAESWGQVTQDLGHEMTKVMSGDAEFAGTTIASNSILGPLAIAGGIWEIADAVKEWGRGDQGGAIVGGLGGLSSIIGGGSSVAALAGSGAAAAVAPLALSAGGGLQLGHYGDGEVKNLGWLHDDDGKAESASQWMGNTMGHADDWVTKHTHSSLLGKGAAALTGLATLLPAGEMAVAGAAVGGYNALTGAGHAIGSNLANRHRANDYSSYEGIDHIQGGAQGMADYDDAQRAAVERANQQRNAKYWQGVRQNMNANPDLGFFESAGLQNRKDAAATAKK